MHYDLQSWLPLVTSSLELDPALVKFAYCVVETVAPYRVQFMIAMASTLLKPSEDASCVRVLDRNHKVWRHEPDSSSRR